MPKPDKTKLRKWDFESFKQHDVKGDVYQSLSQLPESVREIIDVDHSKT